jgi:hypothetical protein
MEPDNQTATTPKDDIRGMRILCLALMVGIIMFSLFTILIIGPGKIAIIKGIRGYFPIILAAAVTIAAISVAVGIRMYNKKLRETVSQTISLADKLNQYRSALILFMACCEMPALLAITVFFMSGNYLLFIVPGLMVLLMASRIPTAQKLITLLQLDWNDQQQLV